MTIHELHELPLSTRVLWNRKGVSYGDEGKVSDRDGQRYIQWDDGATLGLGDSRYLTRLRWVKRITKEPTNA